jgi:putative transcriptional regulator
MTENDNSSLSLKGHLLIAMPRMGDPRFHRAVIFICVHDEKGAMGIGINQKLVSPDFPGLLKQLGITTDAPLPDRFAKMPVLAGGPVEGVRGFLLHSSDFRQKDTIVIDDNFGISGTIDSLRAALAIPPRQMLFTLGYAGWGAGQLEHELQDNAWMTVPATQELVFNTAPDDMWENAFAALGVNPAMLSGLSGTA